MASCDYCGTTILFGGVKDEGLRFCKEKCREEGFYLKVAQQLPADVVQSQMREIHQGACPRCGGDGPVDVQTFHTIWSVLYFTSWNSRPEVCCRRCGVKIRIRSLFSCGLLGWWGFPWGVLGTPIQLTRNFVGLFSGPRPEHPSAELENIVRVDLAQQFVEARQLQEAEKAAAVRATEDEMFLIEEPAE
ncbi:MAG: hypothetical protein KDA79_22455 [Planctomycetaceae bacterium]|nr:hypothetical protein [Planctomycetaceae bacterium]